MAIIQEKNSKKWTKDGRKWYFDIYYNDEFGNRKEKKSKLYKTQKEAKDAERNFFNNLNNNDFNNDNIMFEELYYNWLHIKEKKVKETTYYCILKKVDKHILSFFKGYKLHFIKLDTINKWLETMNSKNLSLPYLNIIIGYVQEIFLYARDNYKFDYRVANNIFQYKINVSVKKNKKSENNYWTFEDFEHFISFVDDKEYYLIFNMLYYTGLRIGELIALNWEDIDFQKNIIDVNKTFTNKVLNKIYDLVDPKTTNSIRKVEIDNNLKELLKKHYNKEKKIYKFNKKMFVIGNVNYLAPTTFSRKLKHYIEISNSKYITPHGFRHSHVSLLINLGCDSREVAERIGDTIEMVEKTYYHLFPHKKSHAINVINKLNAKNTR